MRADLFVSEFRNGGSLHHGVLIALRELVVQISQAALCHRFHSVTKRLACSLLNNRDHAESDTPELTQEALALWLGVAPSRISVAATYQQDQNHVRLRHGRIRILNRTGLERAACECYDIVRNQIGQSRSVHGRSDPRR